MSAAWLALLLLSGGTADAQCRQPTGEAIPTAPGCDGGRTTGLLATFACACDEPGVCNVGERCDPGLPGDSCPDTGMNATCESRMWHAPNDDPCIPENRDGLDPAADCSVEPETFSPTCPLTFTVLTRGTARFGNVFGWYNATGARPAVDDLHVMLGCEEGGEEGEERSVVLDVRGDPRYLGGEIGFFLLTPEDRTASGECERGDCCATLERHRAGAGYVYYSEAALNPEDDAFVHLLVYDSREFDRTFYFAWEDTFNAPNNDFTDLVTSVSGVECGGGGIACDTGDPGVCGRGVSECERGVLACTPLREASDESCNGLDDDCDGEIDDGAVCPAADEVCHQGRCVPHCELGEEFACPIDYECDVDSGFCVEPACEGVSCPPEQVCRGGDCVGDCEGVVCPHGQTCFQDTCRDPCAGVTCAATESCREGVCLPACDQCGGIACGAGEICAESGECVDPSCEPACAAGTHCEAGACVDDCDGAACPPGQSCRGGACLFPGEDRDAGPPTGGDGGGGGADAGSGPGRRSSGCGCRAPGASSASALPALLVAWLALRRRRRGG